MKKMLFLFLCCSLFLEAGCNGRIYVKESYLEKESANIENDTKVIIKDYGFNLTSNEYGIVFKGYLSDCLVGGTINFKTADPVYKMNIEFNQYDGQEELMNGANFWDTFWNGRINQESHQKDFKDYLFTSLQSSPYNYKIIKFDDNKLLSLQQKNDDKKRQEYLQHELEQKKIWNNVNKKSATAILEFINSTDVNNLKENAIESLSNIISKGNLGGGYQEFKWGSTEQKIISVLGNPKSKSDSDNKNLTALNYSVDDKDIQFTFYKEALFEIVVTLNSDGETIFKNLKDKYGKPKMTTSYDTNYMGAWKSKITYQDYKWSDSFTNIRVRYAKTSSICENCDNQYSYTPKLQEAWVNGVVYQSNAIANYIKKIADDEEKEEETKKEKKVKDNL